MMNQGPQNRRSRRDQSNAPPPRNVRGNGMPGILNFLTNPKVFIAMGLIFLAGMLFSIIPGLSTNTNTGGSSGPMQANEAPDVARETPTADGTPQASNTPVAVKRYDQAPAISIDPAKKYTATINTSKGAIQVVLFTDQAIDAVNAFVFLARDGYYNNTPFMQVVTNSDGSKFTAQAGDPTRTGCGTPGFDLNEKPTTHAFDRGAVGYADGQFYISYGDYPSLTGKQTIVGEVTGGMDVLQNLTLQQVRNCAASGSGDSIQTVTVTES